MTVTPYVFDEEYNDARAEIAIHLSGNPDLMEKISQPIATVQQTGIAYRNINNWAEKGIIDDTRTSDAGWRKFSATDLAWIRIVLVLRAWNLPLEAIKNVKDSLFIPFSNKIKNVSNFDIAFAMAQSEGLDYNVYLIISMNGSAVFTNARSIEINKVMGTISNSYMQINLNKIWGSVWKNIKLHIDGSYVLNKAEIEILKELRLEDANKITIEKANGEIQTIKADHLVNLKAEGGLHNIIERFNFGTVNAGVFRNGTLETAVITKTKKIKK